MSSLFLSFTIEGKNDELVIESMQKGLYFNIKSEVATEYLRHLFPPTIQSTTIYPLRNGDRLLVPFCILSITNSSFFPSIVKERNKLTNKKEVVCIFLRCAITRWAR
jgi:hypothetical protein